MKITSEKFMRFYVIASFVLIILLTAGAGVMYKNQADLKDLLRSSRSQTEDVKVQVRSIEEKVDWLRDDVSDAQDEIDAVSNIIHDEFYY